MPPNTPEAAGRLPPNVLALGLVSLLMALSSQITNSLLPVFLVTAMGASIATVGLIEGLAEATNSFLRAFSGAISDAIGRRKPLVVFGAMAFRRCGVKPVFPMAVMRRSSSRDFSIAPEGDQRCAARCSAGRSGCGEVRRGPALGSLAQPLHDRLVPRAAARCGDRRRRAVMISGWCSGSRSFQLFFQCFCLPRGSRSIRTLPRRRGGE